MQEEIQKKSKEIRKVDWDSLYAFSIFFQNSINPLIVWGMIKKKGIAVNSGL